MNSRCKSLALFGLVLCAIRSDAQTSYPMLMSLKPVATQVGATSEHTIHSRYSMHGANQVIVTGTGVTGEIVHPPVQEGDEEKTPNLTTMKVKFTVAKDAALGVRDFRIMTPRGVSTLGQLVVGRDVVVVESAKNDTPENATPIETPATICGTIEKAEDVDYFRFQASAGKALTFHVRSMRLQNKIHDLQKHSDPMLTLRNAAGVTLAASDNFYFGDPLLNYNFTHDGEYLLEIRDVRYQGNKYWDYSIEIGDGPFLTNAFPLGVATGKTTALKPVGFNLPSEPVGEVSVPADASGVISLPVKVGDAETNPVSLVASKLPLLLESDEDNNSPASAQPCEVPVGINGRMDEEGDVDCFAFDAKKGERFSFQVIARRQGSMLDSHLRVLNEKGSQLQLNDDMKLGKRTFADSWVENWAAPADGRYIIEVRDLHLRGGEPFVYFLQVTRSEPYFELYVDTDKTQLTPGTSGVCFVRVVRKNGFAGAIQLRADRLPAAVTADCGRILAGKSVDGCIVFSAAKNAQMDLSNVRIWGVTDDDGETSEAVELSADAVAYQETYQPGGGRGHWPVDMHTVAVGDPSDIRQVTLDTYDLRLKAGESKRVKVTIERVEGFDKNVTLDLLYRHLRNVYGDTLPPGVTIDTKQSKTLLTGKQVEGHITLTAAKDAAAVEKQQVAVMANVSLNFVMKASYSSKPLLVSVEAVP